MMETATQVNRSRKKYLIALLYPLTKDDLQTGPSRALRPAPERARSGYTGAMAWYSLPPINDISFSLFSTSPDLPA